MESPSQSPTFLDGYDLVSFLDGSAAHSKPSITTEGNTTTNPAFTVWKRQDKLIYSALIGAISVSIQPILSSTTVDVWDTLASTYAKHQTTQTANQRMEERYTDY